LWVIVDDGSTDQTAEIIKRYVTKHSWIRYVRRHKDPSQSYYSSNVYAIFEGIKEIQNSERYDYLAVLDADISLPSDYYSQILNRMQSDGKLGIASGVYIDRVGDNKFRKVLNDRRSTPKALMVFKKQCYEDIGGFVPMKYGGEDTCACFTARMMGWKTWSFPDIGAIHNKPVGTGHAKNILKIRFRQGISEYFLATHPLFFLLKSLRRCVKETPVFVGGLVRIAGFICAYFMGQKRQISDELTEYIRKEQLGRVFKLNSIPTECRVEK
jgi:poly-beta-1,6-N-acetyl-D-glucosamine synthase